MILGEKFNKEQFIAWLDSFLPDFQIDIKSVDIPRNFHGVSAIKTFGKSSIGVQVFGVEMDSDPVRKRITITKDSFNLLKNHAIQNALIAYYSPDHAQWRLSLLTSNAVWEDGRVISKLSNLKRQSFVLGVGAKTKTPTKYLAGKVADLAELKKRFSIEVVNKDFYKEISTAFNSLQTVLKLPSKESKSQTNLEFSVRLIGRIIFCWFLREKKSEAGISLISNDVLSLHAVKNTKDYYHKRLEPLFFEVLNKPLESRNFDEFDKDPFNQTPYLNGGLFSAQYDDFYERGKNDLQSKHHNTLVIPNEWLESFFETLETYHFTIDENTSYDEELSIDPEMLGRIFENLLAEINPETGESARKSTGSYYTPRVIVDYMVDESLILYLHIITRISEEKMRALISYDLDDDQSNPLSQEEKEKIIDALGKIKILDPACGSGAFPMGALQKIVFILQQVDQDGSIWKKRQLENADSEFRREIEKRFSTNEIDFLRKLAVIRKSIYGIDIQPIATEISRLRCFLTLIVDENIQDSEKNRGVKPLPNLDFKFVTANTLIGLPKIENPQQLLFDEQNNINKLKELMDDYFSADEHEKLKLINEFHSIQKDLIKQYFSQKDYSMDEQKKILSDLGDWEPFSHKSSDWFDPEWMFGVKDGFDIVITNPPYVDSESMVKNHNDLREKYKAIYSTTKGNWDLYIPFLELGNNLLSEAGTACFITPNKWYAIGYGEEIRKKLYPAIIRVGNCSQIKVFEAGNSPVITMYGKRMSGEEVWVDSYDEHYQISSREQVPRELLMPNFGILLSPYMQLLIKIKLQKYTISDFYRTQNPCSVSEAYLIKEIVREFSDTETGEFFRLTNTGTIDPYISLWGKKQTTYLKNKYSRPVVSKKIFKDRFPKRYPQMIQPKLIISGMRHFESFLDDHGDYIAGKSTEILIRNSNLSLELALGLLNSSLIRFYIKEIYSVLGIDGGINFTTDLISELPFPDMLKNGDLGLEVLVKRVISSAGNLGDTDLKNLLSQIDKIIYRVFGIDKEEIKIVES